MASTLVDLGNKGSSTEGMILETTKRLAAAGTMAGLSTPQIFGLAGAMANLGIEAEAGGTAMSKTLQKMTSAVAAGGPELANFAQVAGLSAAEFRAAFEKDAGAAVGLFIDGLGRMKAGGADLMPVFEALELKDVRMKDALGRLALAQGEVTKQMGIAGEAYQKNTALPEEAAKKFATFANQFLLVKNRLTDVAITLGEPILRAVASLLEGLKPVFGALEQLAAWFAQLPQPIQTAVVAFLGLLAAIGPIVYVAGTLISSWGAVAGLLSTKLASGLTVAGDRSRRCSPARSR